MSKGTVMFVTLAIGWPFCLGLLVGAWFLAGGLRLISMPGAMLIATCSGYFPRWRLSGFTNDTMPTNGTNAYSSWWPAYASWYLEPHAGRANFRRLLHAALQAERDTDATYGQKRQ